MNTVFFNKKKLASGNFNVMISFIPSILVTDAKLLNGDLRLFAVRIRKLGVTFMNPSCRAF